MLASQTEVKINFPNLACHAAVWFWAAQEAGAQGLTPGGWRSEKTTLERIGGLTGGGQAAMLDLPKSDVDFSITLTTPQLAPYYCGRMAPGIRPSSRRPERSHHTTSRAFFRILLYVCYPWRVIVWQSTATQAGGETLPDDFGTDHREGRGNEQFLIS
jgi:hypothetical protein